MLNVDILRVVMLSVVAPFWAFSVASIFARLAHKSWCN